MADGSNGEKTAAPVEAKPGMVSSVLETALTAAAVAAATTLVHSLFKWLRGRR